MAMICLSSSFVIFLFVEFTSALLLFVFFVEFTTALLLFFVGFTSALLLSSTCPGFSFSAQPPAVYS